MTIYELTMNLKKDQMGGAFQHKIHESLQLNRSTISSYLNQAFVRGELDKEDKKLSCFCFYIEVIRKRFYSDRQS